MAARGHLTMARSLREWLAGSAAMWPKMYLATAAIGMRRHARGAVPCSHDKHTVNTARNDVRDTFTRRAHSIGWLSQAHRCVARDQPSHRGALPPRPVISHGAVMFVQVACKWGIAPLHAARRRAPRAPASVPGPPTWGAAGARPRPRVGAFGATQGPPRGKPIGLDAMHGNLTTIVLSCCEIHNKQ